MLLERRIDSLISRQQLVVLLVELLMEVQWRQQSLSLLELAWQEQQLELALIKLVLQQL